MGAQLGQRVRISSITYIASEEGGEGRRTFMYASTMIANRKLRTSKNTIIIYDTCTSPAASLSRLSRFESTILRTSRSVGAPCTRW
jgi:hypothetical protein